jgi:hypothetical protein
MSFEQWQSARPLFAGVLIASQGNDRRCGTEAVSLGIASMLFAGEVKRIAREKEMPK